MPAIPVDPSFGISGGEWAVELGDGGTIVAPGAAEGTAGGDFGSMLADQIGALEKTQTEAAEGARALAAGTASDPTAVIMAVDRARLSMELAGQIRTKAVDAIQDIFHMQV